MIFTWCGYFTQFTVFTRLLGVKCWQIHDHRNQRLFHYFSWVNVLPYECTTKSVSDIKTTGTLLCAIITNVVPAIAQKWRKMDVEYLLKYFSFLDFFESFSPKTGPWTLNQSGALRTDYIKQLCGVEVKELKSSSRENRMFARTNCCSGLRTTHGSKIIHAIIYKPSFLIRQTMVVETAMTRHASWWRLKMWSARCNWDTVCEKLNLGKEWSVSQRQRCWKANQKYFEHERKSWSLYYGSASYWYACPITQH